MQLKRTGDRTGRLNRYEFAFDPLDTGFLKLGKL
jgi:hypothetical protein